MQFGRGKPSAGAFFDSDFSTIDDILTVSLLYGMQAKNDCKVAVFTMSRPDLGTAGFVDTVERFYHGPAAVFAQLPAIGMRTVGTPGVTPAAFTAPFEKKKPDGTPLYTNQIKRVLDTGDPNTLFRNYLQAQYDQNAFFILGGPATNLAALLDFRGMKDLIAAKAKYLVIAGEERRFKADLPAVRKVLAEWPTQVFLVGSEVGTALPFPGASIDKEFAATPNHPVAEAYRALQPMPYDAPSWSVAAALYAGRPKEGYFKVSEPGTISVQDDGKTTFAASAQGKHQQLTVDPAQKEKVLQAFVDLASAKPVPPQRFRPPAAADQKKADPADAVVVPKPQP